MDEQKTRSLAKRALSELRELRATVKRLQEERREPIAVVGMDCRLPGGADSPNDYWRRLLQGTDAVEEIPKERWNVDEFFDENLGTKGKMITRRGGFLRDVDAFDADLFRIPPADAEQMDPQHRLLLETSWTALERAGYSPADLSGHDVGVFAGVMTEDYLRLIHDAVPLEELNAATITGNGHSVLAGRISHTLGFQGPTITVETACSSSLVAVHLACQALRNQECDTAIAAGVHLILVPDLHVIQSRTGTFAPDGRCKPFDAAADGMVSSEGCVAIALMRYADARSSHANILALITGSVVNHDGPASGLTAPNWAAQKKLVRRALLVAGEKPAAISYLEGHGTGTSLGDPIEARALGEVFSDRVANRRLGLGSVKANIGHTGPVSGVAGLCKVVLALQREELPPQIHLQTVNPHIEIERIPAVLPTAPTPWPKSAERRVAGVSAFGLSGTNAHVVLAEAPAEEPPAEKSQLPLDRSHDLLCLSAASENGLLETSVAYQRSEELESAPWPDVCFTAGVGRAHQRHRIALVGASVAEAREKLAAHTAGKAPLGLVTGQADRQTPEVAFLYTGHGSNFVGMGQTLYDSNSAFRDALQRCDQILEGKLEKPLLELLFHDQGNALANDMSCAQPALFSIQYALTELWRSFGIEPSVVMGYSTGEYAAASAAGVFALEDVLQLLVQRGRMIQDLPSDGDMLVVPEAVATVEKRIARYTDRVTVAAENAPEYTIVSGERTAIDALYKELRDGGVLVRQLGYTAGGHSPLMDPILDEFEALVADVPLSPPGVDMVSTRTGRLAEGEDICSASYWRRHLRERVRFVEGVDQLHARGCRLMVEIGPNPTLLGLAGLCLPEDSALFLPSLRRVRDDWEQLFESLGTLYVQGVEPDWHGLQSGRVPRRVVTPTHPFERKRYWIQGSGGRAVKVKQQRENIDEWFYEVQWRPVAVQEAPTTADGLWLVFVDEGDVGQSAARELEQRGCRVVQVARGDGYAVMPSGERRLNPEDVSGYAQLLSEVGPVSGVLYFWALDEPSPEAFASVEELARVCQGVFSLIQGISATGRAVLPRVWIATRGAQVVGEGATCLAVTQALLWGLGQVLILEHPMMWGGLVDLEPDGDSEEAAASLVKVVLNSHGEDQLAVRSGEFFSRRITKSTTPPVAASVKIDGDGSYLITGGLGGIGLEVARWLAEQGARHLVLVGRRGLTDASADPVAALEAAGVNVMVGSADVASATDLERIFADIDSSMPPLRGVFHAAGVPGFDRVIDLKWDDFAEVMAPKVVGTWNLHTLTELMPLDHFVLFSSQASLLGTVGLSGYVAGNTFLDAVSHHRRLLDLPGLSINWGAWGEVGLAQDPRNQEVTSRWKAGGAGEMSPESALRGLDKAMRIELPQIAITRMDWQRLRDFPAFEGRPLLREVSSPPLGGSQQMMPPTSGELDFVKRYAATAQQSRLALVTDYLRDLIARSMGFSTDRVQDDERLARLGLDSLKYIELRNTVRQNLAVEIPMQNLIEGTMTLAGLAQLVNDLLGGSTTETPGQPPKEHIAAQILAKLDPEPILARMEDFTEEELDYLIGVLSPTDR